jgi:hypothetical protein
VFHPARHYDELALLNPFMAVAEIHAEAAFDYEEHLVLILMMVKDELAIQLDEFDVLAVELGGDAGLVVFGDFRKLLGNVDLGHGNLRFVCCCVEWMAHLAWASQENSDG